MKKEKLHLIFDFETLGSDPKTNTAVDVSFFIMDWDRFTTKPYSFNELTKSIKRAKLDVKTQVKEFGTTYSKSDIEFWTKRSSDIQKLLKPLPIDLKPDAFAELILNELEGQKISYWWSRSSTFDPVVLWRLFEFAGLKDELDKILPFWKFRDIRTFIDAKFNFSIENNFIPITDRPWWIENYKEHVSIHDVAGDVLRLQSIERGENDLEQVER